MFNLAGYTKAIEEAESSAVHYKSARVIVYRPEANAFGHYFLNVHTLNESPDWQELIVASVDHHGIITESKWVKEQIEKLGEVAA